MIKKIHNRNKEDNLKYKETLTYKFNNKKNKRNMNWFNKKRSNNNKFMMMNRNKKRDYLKKK